MMQSVTSWGRVAKAEQLVHEPGFADELPALLSSNSSSIAYGLGRSYGDSCLNGGGSLIRMHRLDRVLGADWDQGVVRAEAGMSLDALLRLCVPKGWFLPVTPGTKFVTLGGAVANDVHGKNHETAGTFGCHVRRIGLLRSMPEVLELAPDGDGALFAATVGGLGLTGLILWVELKLAPIRSAYFVTETKRMRNLDDFFELARDSRDWPYTASWVDCLADGPQLGTGLFTRGRHSEDGELKPHRTRSIARVPADAPAGLLSSPMLRAFNLVYANRPKVERLRHLHYDSFLYPLDGIQDWNRLYGRAGFFQHQSVVPLRQARPTLQKLLELIAAHRQGSSLVVLKLFGDRPSPGLLSFPIEGATFALDLPNRGKATRDLLDRMEDVVLKAEGRLYPAKDATMSAAAFRAGFPRWREVEARRDPALMSDFWRRVTRKAA
jgi:FAD/FMN-containing dehydrogenase